ncbi:phosphotransferase [Embleya sp. NPDC059237]|uniref:phosphotransferase n=1 Tax=Embleya sp. NPDC059237 TaxID=3346784 RepID=UPI0036C3D6D4
MSGRLCWVELPSHVRGFVDSLAGPVRSVARSGGPHGSSFVATVTTPTGRVFVKVAEEAGAPLAARAQTSEIAASAVTGVLSPQLLRHGTVDGWRVLVFEHVEGRPLRFRLDSPDFVQVVGAIDRIGRIQPGRSAGLPTLVGRLREHLPPDRASALCGNRLLHTDLISGHMLIRPDGRLSVVDWGRVAIGPRWAEIAFVGANLLRANHDLHEVRRWMWRFPEWRRTPHAARRTLAEAMIGRHGGRAVWWTDLVDTPIAR